MADIDINLSGEHDKTDKLPDTGEAISFTLRGVLQRWEPRHEQETSFGGTSQRTGVLREHIKALYHVVSKETEAFHFHNLDDGKLYYRDKSTSLMIEGGKLRSLMR